MAKQKTKRVIKSKDNTKNINATIKLEKAISYKDKSGVAILISMNENGYILIDTGGQEIYIQDELSNEFIDGLIELRNKKEELKIIINKLKD